MSASTPAYGDTGSAATYREPVRRLTTETKAAYKTTELIAYVVAVIGVLIASAMVGENDNDNDFFRADRAWLYITVLTVGYMISRGLAKSGSREPYDEDRNRR